MKKIKLDTALSLNSEINVTPFVDVMLVLLVVFMITSPMLISGMNVDLPKVKGQALEPKQKPLVISLDKSGNTFVDENKVSTNQLPKYLKTALEKRSDKRIFIKGDKSVDYGKVMNLFGKIIESGYSNVSLITETPSEKT